VRELPGYDREDLAQEAFVGILRAARTFDPQRGRSFAEWAARWAIQQVLDRVRWSRRHEPELLADSLEWGEDDQDRRWDRAEGPADPRQDPQAIVEETPRRRLAWAIVAMAERAGGQAKAALDLLTGTDGDEGARAAAREALRPVVAAAMAAVIRQNSFRGPAGRRVA
jgi:RNA polymerase sigma factor (sigma-70 family)